VTVILAAANGVEQKLTAYSAIVCCFGQSSHWRSDPTPSAIHRLPDVGEEISPKGSFLIS